LKVIGSFVVSWILALPPFPFADPSASALNFSAAGDAGVAWWRPFHFVSNFYSSDETADETLTVVVPRIESPGKRLRAGR